MSARQRFLLTWIGLSLATAVAFSAIYLHFALQAKTEEFRTRAELLAWTFADRVAFDLAQGNRQDLGFLTGTLVLGNVLYAQVIQHEEILSEISRLEEPLPPTVAPTTLWQFERRVSHNQPYWDIRRSLPDGNGYVRLGLALEPLDNAIRSHILLVSALSFAFLLLAALVTFYWARRLFLTVVPHQAPVARPERYDTSVAADAAATTSTLPDSAPSAANSSVIQLGDLVIDDSSKTVQMRSHAVELSPKEFELLRLLASEPGRVFSSQEILARVWTDSHLATAQDVKQYIYFLRQKLEANPQTPQRILTVRGFGYKLQA
jgi:DNA-binding winged helix-turn-helix (wHTH) protein